MKYLHLLLKNLTRKKVRTTFTFLSILVAFFLFGLLMAVRHGFNAGIEIAGQERLLTIHKVSLIQPLPIRYMEQIGAMEGVAGVSHASWFGGIYQDPKNFFAQIAIDAETYLDLYPELLVPEDQLRTFRATRTGALAGKKLADRFGWKVGDRIPIRATIWRPTDGGSDTYEFELVGLYEGATQDVDETMFFFQYDYLKERVGDLGLVGWYVISIENPEEADRVALAIDERYANSPYETKTTTEKAFMQSWAKQIGNTGAILTTIAAIVFFVCLLIAGNTMAQAVRERTAEVGVLKTLGFTDGGVLAMVLAESLLLSGLAGGLGLLLVYLLAPGVAHLLQGFLPVFYVPDYGLALGVLFVVLLGVVSGLLPALSASRLRIVDALRRV